MTLSSREAALSFLSHGTASRDVLLSQVEDHRDRALASALISGTMKWRGLLDDYLAAFSHRPLRDISPKVLAALRLGAFQLLMLGIKPHASVSTTVAALGRRSEKAFVNGVLRAMSRLMGHVEMPELDDNPVLYGALRFSYPLWMVKLFVERFGLKDAFRLCDLGNKPPPFILRVNRLKTTEADLLRHLDAGGIEASSGLIPGTVMLRHGIDVTALPGFSEGHFVVQDTAAMVVSLVLNPKPGERVWDACAAPGGKTAHLAELMEDRGELVATDLEDDRLRMVEETALRMGFTCVAPILADASREYRDLPYGVRSRPFDKVLLDAPCSGLGVIRRNPDLRWNRQESDIGAMVSKQKILLRSVAETLKTGGVLVYSTCTLTKEENEDTWEGFLKDAGDMAAEDPAEALAPEVKGLFSESFVGPGFRYLLPHESGTDGFFVARARKMSQDVSR